MNHERLNILLLFILAKTFWTAKCYRRFTIKYSQALRKVTVFFHVVFAVTHGCASHRSEALIGWASRWGGRNVIHYGLRWEEGLFDSTLYRASQPVRSELTVLSLLFVSNGCLQAGSHSPWRELLEPGESLLWLVRRGPERDRGSGGKERRSSFKRFV